MDLRRYNLQSLISISTSNGHQVQKQKIERSCIFKSHKQLWCSRSSILKGNSTSQQTHPIEFQEKIEKQAFTTFHETIHCVNFRCRPSVNRIGSKSLCVWGVHKLPARQSLPLVLLFSVHSSGRRWSISEGCMQPCSPGSPLIEGLPEHAASK